MDWHRTGYSYTVMASVIHQTDIENNLGSLKNFDLQSITITENYNSDSRIQAKIKTVVAEGQSDGYVDNARIRITLLIPDRDFAEELITGYVSNIDLVKGAGYIERTYTIEGTIWGILEHKLKSQVTIGKGSTLLSVWSGLVSKQTKMQYTTRDAQDHTFNTNIVYEAGTVLSTLLFEICSGYNRMENDGHGRLVLEKYVAPSNRTPSRIVNYADFNSIAYGDLSYSSEDAKAPGRAIVTATVSVEKDGKTIQKVVVGSYDAPSTHETSINIRGWLSARSDSYSGSSEKPSKSELDDEAKKNWENSQEKKHTWSGESVFANYHAGEVITLVTPTDAEMAEKERCVFKCLITNVSTNLGEMTQTLTMKEV